MGAGGRISRCISAGTAGRCAALLGGKSAGGTAGGGTGGDRRPVGFGGADTGSRSALRRDWRRRFGILCCLLIAGFVTFGILDRSGAFLQKVERAYTVGIWQYGEKIGETAVTISRERSIWGRSYDGRFAIDAVEKTCRERMQAMIRWEKKSNCANITFAEPGFFGAQAGIEHFLYCDRELNWFALSLEDGRIIASDQGWAQLQALRPYEYPVYVN